MAKANEIKKEVPVVAIAGVFQYGKSTLINCLLADNIADMGDGLPTTHAVGIYSCGEEGAWLYYDDDSNPKYFRMDDYWDIHDKHKNRLDEWKKKLIEWNQKRGEQKDQPKKPKGSFDTIHQIDFNIPRKNLNNISLMDTPGVNSTDESDTARTFEALKKADFIIVLVSNKQFDQPQKDLLRDVSSTGKPFTIIMNCMDAGKWDPKSDLNNPVQETLAQEIESMGQNPWKIGESTVWSCNILWYWCAMLKKANHTPGSRFTTKLDETWDDISHYFNQRKKPVPDFEELAKISNVQPLIDFITGNGTKAKSLPNLIAMNKAFEGWKQEILDKIEDAKAIINK